MIALLILLTSMNFFIYAQPDAGTPEVISTELADTDDNDNTPAGPDEKTPGGPLSFSEEFLHDEKETSSLFIDNLIHQLLLERSKLHPAHFELITPPPDLIG